MFLKRNYNHTGYKRIFNFVLVSSSLPYVNDLLNYLYTCKLLLEVCNIKRNIRSSYRLTLALFTQKCNNHSISERQNSILQWYSNVLAIHRGQG